MKACITKAKSKIGEMSVEVMAYHHSHDEFFRSPFGALQCGSPLTLRLFIQSQKPIDECFLRLWVEDREYRQPMSKSKYQTSMPCSGTAEEWKRNIGSRYFTAFSMTRIFPERLTKDLFPGQNDYQNDAVYGAHYEVPDKPGLIWYFFVFVIDGVTYFYGNNELRLGGVGQLSSKEPPGYQITVYKPMVLPSWYTKGIMYQIYVDRFYNGDEQGKVLNPRPRSLLHGDWYDTPFYIKNPQGEILRWDFFGGNLLGVIKKLPYLKELGVSIIYLNPIFDAASNHKYDTGNYLAIDPMYGDEETFARMVQEAQDLGIVIILDGVFSHTGDDSIYFNRYGNYPSLGAYQSPDSSYCSWYKCTGKDNYSCWWGVKTLPEVQEMEPSYREFIIHSPQGVLQTWMRYGIKGWRLDVADELPDEFIQDFRQVMKEMDSESVLIGEVWEDATNKFSYGKLRQYFWGAELDATMNYPFRKIFLQYLLGNIDAGHVHERIMNLCENYPRENFFGQMNLVGSHDRARILTLLGEAPPTEQLTVAQQENYRLSPHQRWVAIQRLKLFLLIQMSFPGVPCLYYGDEAGLEGYPDPFNRGTYPWGRENPEILEWTKRVLSYRREYEVLHTGDFHSYPLEKDIYAFSRKGGKEEIIVLVNPHLQETKEVVLEIERDVDQVIDIFAGRIIYQRDSDRGYLDSTPHNCKLSLSLPPLNGKTLFCQREAKKQYFKEEIMTRSCGILMHISSLPSPWGIGDMGKEAYDFVDFLAQAGQSLWQVLPLNPLGLGDSPYQSESAFAGNPLLISMDMLIKAGLLTEKEVYQEYRKSAEDVGYKDNSRKYEKENVITNENLNESPQNFAWVREYKEVLLRKAYSRFKELQTANATKEKGEECNKDGTRSYDSGCEKNPRDYLDPSHYQEFIAANTYWLKDYALYKSDLTEDIDYIYFVQYTFECQWQKLKSYANNKQIKIVGDIPIFVAADSADTWANPKLFALDEQNAPLSTAGVPPDYFSLTGQNWGNPLYNWEVLAASDYAWWKFRFKQGLSRFDILRLDHFRGFEAYWEIPAQARTAVGGRWIKGPGKRFFESMVREFGPLPLIAEDLGTITPEVNTLKAIFGFPGMRVIQFLALEEEEIKEAVYYTGTHDNDTLLGWYQFQGYDEITAREQAKKAIEKLYQGAGVWVIIPLQDVLGLDSKARMNIPGTIEGNWAWRVEKDVLTKDVSDELKRLAQKYGRG